MASTKTWKQKSGHANLRFIFTVVLPRGIVTMNVDVTLHYGHADYWYNVYVFDCNCDNNNHYFPLRKKRNEFKIFKRIVTIKDEIYGVQ